jgi:hypothetical protein
VSGEIPLQTSQVLLGAGTALVYGLAVLSLGLLPLLLFLGKETSSIVRNRIGLFGLLWLGFVFGQGITGLLWLILSLVGIMHSWLILTVGALGFGLALIAVVRLIGDCRKSASRICVSVSARLDRRSFYLCVVSSIVIIAVLRGVIALLPASNPDAIRWYLVAAKIIAVTHVVEFQPFISPHSALYPLQVEMHWASLFAISNETAVTVWDYLCAISFLSGVGFLAWSITSSRRVAVLAMLMVLSTPGFYDLIGGGKSDNAASQYGIAAFLAVFLWPIMGQRAGVLAGLFAGWAMAARYTNVIILPALVVFAAIMVWNHMTTVNGAVRKGISAALNGTIAAGVVGLPMLFKNWLLVGCPLAPYYGCENAFWTDITSYTVNLSLTDLFLYPFVWTFAYRGDMYGNLSPLFVGFALLFWAYRRCDLVRLGRVVGLCGLISIGMWLLIEPFALCTRWLLIPVGLLAIPLSASVVVAEQASRTDRRLRWAMMAPIIALFFFLLFQSRAAVYAVRYLASIDSRATRYDHALTAPNRYLFRVAEWLNANVEPGQRVGIYNCCTFRYFLNPDVLLNSESKEEMQWLWENESRLSPSNPLFWEFYAKRGFTYVVIPTSKVDEALKVLERNIGGEIVFTEAAEAVLRIGSI